MDFSSSPLLTFNNPNITVLWFERCPMLGLGIEHLVCLWMSLFWEVLETFGDERRGKSLMGVGHSGNFSWPFPVSFSASEVRNNLVCTLSSPRCSAKEHGARQPTKPSETVRWKKSLFLKVTRSGFWSHWDNSNKDNRGILAVFISWLSTFLLCCVMAVQGLCKPH